jgi:iron(III) transport system ATP-binding protein
VSNVTLEELTVGYGTVPVLHSISLTIPGPGITCVLGPSGCGKTTLLRAVAGFIPATTGTIRIGDRVVDDPAARKHVVPEQRRVGYVPQEGSLFPHLTVAQNVGFALSRRQRADRRARQATISDTLALVGMEEFAARYPHELSGGQQQRVAVARALACSPDVVLLDEPFASLDAALRGRIRQDIRRILGAAATTAVLVTHDRAEALSVADHVVVVFDGTVHQTGTPQDVYTRPLNANVASFLGDANLLPALVNHGRATTVLGTLRVDPHAELEDGPATIVVRPENLLVHPITEEPRDPVETTGTVRNVEYYGRDAKLEIFLDADPTSPPLTARFIANPIPAIGSRVAIQHRGDVWPLRDPRPRDVP